jgi:hypothetical protein
MATKVILSFLLIIFIVSCSDHRQLKNVDTSFKFTTYEVSFRGGWSNSFSLLVDTSKVFLAAYKFDTLRYGILPDSIFEIINKTAFTILTDKSITNTNEDCSSISVLVTLNRYTVRLLQKGNISNKVFFPHIDAITKYLKTSKSSWKLNPFPQFIFETIEPILPPRPPQIRPTSKKKIKS